MNPVRRYLRDVFGFSGNEINGFLILLPLMTFAIFSEPLYRAWLANSPRPYRQDQQQLDSLLAHADFHVSMPLVTTAKAHVARFAFDPNTAAIGEFDSLHIPRNLANRIAAYRLKGGVFRMKSDLMKIYGLDSALYHQLYPYIKLPETRSKYPMRDGTSHQGAKFAVSGKRRVSLKDTFDINTADTTVLKSVYGIGSKLAARIIKFREALGGFVKIEQLGEVYGLDSLVVNRLVKVSFVKADFIPTKININRADETRLSAHPYLRHRIARALVTFRYQHGDFAGVNDIKKVSILGDQEIDRVLPYLKVSD